VVINISNAELVPGPEPEPEPEPTPEPVHVPAGNVYETGDNDLFEQLTFAEFNYEKYFDFTVKDYGYSWEYGTAENEELFRKILCGERDGDDYLGWYAYYPEYIYRENETRFWLSGIIAECGEFPQELRDKYFGLLINTAPNGGIEGVNYHYLYSFSQDGMSYYIYFNEDWTVKYISVCEYFNVRTNDFFGHSPNFDGEYRQILYSFLPNVNADGEFDGSYRLNFTELQVKDYTIHTTYEYLPFIVYYDGKYINATAKCVISPHSNDYYGIRLYTADTDAVYWDLTAVWEAYRNRVSVPHNWGDDHWYDIVIKFGG
jgi:hypothetical protein